jgi:hypothetical protein
LTPRFIIQEQEQRSNGAEELREMGLRLRFHDDNGDQRNEAKFNMMTSVFFTVQGLYSLGYFGVDFSSAEPSDTLLLALLLLFSETLDRKMERSLKPS